MAWRRRGDKPLSEQIVLSLLTHICVTQPQWVNDVELYLQNNIKTSVILWLTKIDDKSFKLYCEELHYYKLGQYDGWWCPGSLYCQTISSHGTCRGHFRCTPSQWEPLLHCNDVSHWLGAHLDWTMYMWYYWWLLCMVPRGMDFKFFNFLCSFSGKIWFADIYLKYVFANHSSSVRGHADFHIY